jgi:putative ABC transport system substrate-binding protein
MRRKLRSQLDFSCSDNRKSKIQNRKLVGIIAFVITFAMCGVAALAQQPKRVFRIGYLSDSAPAREAARSEAMGLALRELGYIEGNNIVTEYRYAAGKVDRAPELAAELVRLKADIILIAGGPTQSRAAKNATTTIPIVMMGDGADPVETGLIESLARPGGNVTGITLLNRELGGKRLELLKEAVPKLARVAVLYDPANPYNKRELKEVLPVPARSLGLTIQTWPVQDANALEKELAAMGKQRPDGIYSTSSRQMIAIERRIAEFALKSGLPSLYAWREAVEAGGLMYYGADSADSYRRVAYYVDRILKGAKPADLPVEQPTKFELVINLKTAKQIGVTIPSNVLARANKVIK